MSLHVEELGDTSAPAILLLHGVPSPAADLRPLGKVLEQRFRVVIPDMPGYGGSTRLSRFSWAAATACVAEGLQQRGIRRLRGAVGFSGGGYHALALALDHQIPIDTIVLLGGHAGLPAEATQPTAELGRALQANPGMVTDPGLRQMFAARMLSDRWRAAHPDDAESVQRWLDLAPSALADELATMPDAADLRPRLGSLAATVVARVGELDVACPPSVSEEICRLCSNSTMQTVPGAGHAILIEDAQGTLNAIRNAFEA